MISLLLPPLLLGTRGHSFERGLQHDGPRMGAPRYQRSSRTRLRRAANEVNRLLICGNRLFRGFNRVFIGVNRLFRGANRLFRGVIRLFRGVQKGIYRC